MLYDERQTSKSVYRTYNLDLNNGFLHTKRNKGRRMNNPKDKACMYPYSFAAIFNTQQGNQRSCPPQKASLILAGSSKITTRIRTGKKGKVKISARIIQNKKATASVYI